MPSLPDLAERCRYSCRSKKRKSPLPLDIVNEESYCNYDIRHVIFRVIFVSAQVDYRIHIMDGERIIE